MADKEKKDEQEAPPRRRRVVIVNSDGAEAPQIEMALGDPIRVTDKDGKKYLQFRIA